MIRLSAFLAAFMSAAMPAMAADGIVTRVIDSDTYAIIVFPDDAPGIALITRKKAKAGVAWDGAHVRLRGVDTPESFRPKCPHEAMLARRAKAFVRGMLKPGMHVKVRNIGLGKYAGRIVADVLVRRNGEWTSVADMLIENGLAYRYDGGTKRSWCGGEK